MVTVDMLSEMELKWKYNVFDASETLAPSSPFL